jgi:transposase
MAPLRLRLKKKDRETIGHLLKYEEPRVIRRANILNCLHLGYPAGEIAQILQVDPKTVTNVGNAYQEAGLEAALFDEERGGRPIDFDDRERSRIVAMVCADPPQGCYRWTLDLIAEEAQKRNLIDGPISRETVRVILQEHDLKPWQEKMWCIGHLWPKYIQKMEDVLDVYERPYNERYPVVCLDEKPVPLIADARERLLPDGPGEVVKKDYEYVRNGSVNVFCAVEPKRGRYFNKVTDTRDAIRFAQLLKCLDGKYPSAKRIVLVMDNLSTHKEKSLIER